MFDVGGSMGELLLIFIVALLVLGPRRLPELGKSLGRAMQEFKKATNEFKQNLDAEVGTAQIKEELLKQQREIQTKLAALGTEDTKPETDEASASPAEIKTETPPEASTVAPAQLKEPETIEAQKSYAG